MQTVLLVSFVPPNNANTIFDHENSLIDNGKYYVRQFNPIGKTSFPFNLEQFDVVILHYSIILFSENYISLELKKEIAAFRGLKVMFIQDEYRFVRDALDAMIYVGVDLLFTCVPPEAIEPIYGQLHRRGVRIEQTLTGYVPDALTRLSRSPIDGRPLDVVYRGRVVPEILGKLAAEKVFIARQMRELAPRYGLKVDVDWLETARIYGGDWNRFLSSGRTALGTESGASIADLTGDLDHVTRLIAKAAPDTTFDKRDLDYLADFEGNIVINTISPRAFEAIALGTALVQFPGHYSGILHPGEHYIVLYKDFSNLEQVAEAIRDTAALQTMADAAHKDIVASGHYSYHRFAAETYRVIAEEWERRIYRHPVPVPRILGVPSHEERTLPDLATWHALIDAENLHDPAAPRFRNVALANFGASISASVPFFGRPHDPDYLLREALPHNYAAALDGGQTPQWIEIDLGRLVNVDHVEIDWYSFDNHPERISIATTVDAGERWSELDTMQVETEHTRIDMVGRLVRTLRITVLAFFGQQRMLIKGVRVFEAEPPFR